MISIKGKFYAGNNTFTILDKTTPDWKTMTLDTEQMLELLDCIKKWHNQYKQQRSLPKKEYSRQYYLQHRERMLANARNYYQQHKEYFRERRRRLAANR